MNKNELIEAMASAADISKNAAARALDAFVDSVTSSLSNGDDVVLVGFGSFTTSQRAARTGRNPQTGQTMQIPAATVARFKAGKKLKEAVNKD
ncbi:HU family DNA-binding protein [Candidiatus Paracoxiella cheracis]|uniref:HU family DNA-binding protein n=1 Tax=Candidiatus Paracoxiella cheracis TaxID=3405120 RepID=UPI003BF59E19